MAAHPSRVTPPGAHRTGSFADDDRRELHRLLALGFDDAAARTGTTDAVFRIGSERVRVRTTGAALATPLTRAMGHLQADAGTRATATIDAWDSAGTGRELPLLVDHLLRLLDRTWLEDRDVRGELRAFRDGPVRAAYYGPQLLSVYDVERRAGIFWLRDATMLPWYESGAPFRVLIDWIVAAPTRQLLHAGAVAGPTGGLLLGGAAGSGKSTTALASLGHPELRYVSDDYVVVDVEPEPVAAGVYSTAKLKDLGDVARFAPLSGAVVNRERAARSPDDPAAEKPMLFVHETAPDRMATEVPVRALVFPRYLALDECTVAPLVPDVAFKLLAPSTVQQAPSAGAATLRCLRTLTRRVPAFGLGLPTDPRKIPDALLAILAGVS